MASTRSSTKKWDIIGEDVTTATLNFLKGKYLLKETNQTFITLIPKTERPEQVSQFRPIILCNTSYKVISKCLVRRLQPIMKDIIGDFQSTFIPERSINDNCLLAREMLSYLKRKKRKDARFEFILNLDLNKAYDKISWDFVEKVLKKIGLPEVWRHIIIYAIHIFSIILSVSQWRSYEENNSKSWVQTRRSPISLHFYLVYGNLISSTVKETSRWEHQRHENWKKLSSSQSLILCR